MKLAEKLTQALDKRRRLRSRGSLHIAIADRFSHLNVESWRAVTAGQSFFHSAEYQRGFERFSPANIEPRYALICDRDEPLATLCMQIARVDLRQVGDNSLSGKFEELRSRVQQRVLVCGNLLAYGLHGVCFREGVDRSLVWPIVTEVLYRVRRAEKLAGHTDLVLIKDMDETALAESRVLADLSYGAVPTEPNMVLTVNPGWRSHEGYLKSLTSKYRSDIKNRIFKKFDEAGCRIERLENVGAHAGELHSLYLQVQGNATLRPFTLPESYWPGLAETAGENVVIHVARQDDRIIGFILTLKDGDTAFAYHIGFDRPTAERGVPIYLRLLHESLAQAIAFDCRRVSFGRTALEPKSRMGCAPQPTYIWARHRHPVLNQFVQPFLKLIEPVEAPQFTPFKDVS